MINRYEVPPDDRNTPNRLAYKSAATLSTCALLLAGCNNQNQLPDYGTEPVVIQPGDTLTDIARKQLQECDQDKAKPDNFISSRDLRNTIKRIEANNDLSDPSSIAALQALEVPVLCEANAVSPGQPADTIATN